MYFFFAFSVREVFDFDCLDPLNVPFSHLSHSLFRCPYVYDACLRVLMGQRFKMPYVYDACLRVLVGQRFKMACTADMVDDAVVNLSSQHLIVRRYRVTSRSPNLGPMNPSQRLPRPPFSS